MNVITHIQLNTNYPTGTDAIEKVYANGYWQTVASVVRQISLGQEFRSGTWFGPKVEAVHPRFGNSYIRSGANGTTSDNLLSLPSV